MSKIIAYEIMERATREPLMFDLELILKSNEGWDTAGGVAVAHSLRVYRGEYVLSRTYLQAVVQRAHKKNFS